MFKDGLTPRAVFGDAAAYLDHVARLLAADIMATPATDRAHLDRLDRAGRAVGQAAEHLRNATEALRALDASADVARTANRAAALSRFRIGGAR